MKNLRIENIECLTELTFQEAMDINGGATTVKTPFWYDLAYLAGVIVHGVGVFTTQIGRNAGLCVR